jgi:hypothetical protein
MCSCCRGDEALGLRGLRRAGHAAGCELGRRHLTPSADTMGEAIVLFRSYEA